MGSEVNGKKKYILVMSDRTSDWKMNQALSEAVRAAETANRAKSMFLSNMSHDIRTLMNAIIVFTTLAVSNIDDKKRVRIIWVDSFIQQPPALTDQRYTGYEPD